MVIDNLVIMGDEADMQKAHQPCFEVLLFKPSSCNCSFVGERNHYYILFNLRNK